MTNLMLRGAAGVAWLCLVWSCGASSEQQHISSNGNITEDASPGASDAGNDALLDAAPPPVIADAGHAAPEPQDAGVMTALDAEVASCPALAWDLGSTTTVMLEHGGMMRSYVVHVGKDVLATKAAPLIVNFHGLNNSAAIQQLFSNMNPFADNHGLIVVYPEGLNNSFNAGGCCGSSSQNKVDDLGFARAIIADVSAKTCVDAHRVYATGFSNGGFMSHRAGCEASDIFAGIAPIAGANQSPTCSPARGVSVFAINAPPDPIVSYDQGHMSALDWVARNQCNGDPTHEAYGASSCDTWSDCKNGTQVRFCSWAGGTHLWPGDNTDVPATKMLWEFLSQFTLP
jgi:polyhydroxybutyrate depolymerase